jgi:hypothetical protein
VLLPHIIEHPHRRRGRRSGHGVHEIARARVALLLRLAAELDEQPAAALRQHLDAGRVDARLDHVVDEAIVHPFEPIGLKASTSGT